MTGLMERNLEREELIMEICVSPDVTDFHEDSGDDQTIQVREA